MYWCIKNNRYIISFYYFMTYIYVFLYFNYSALIYSSHIEFLITKRLKYYRTSYLMYLTIYIYILTI